MNSKNQLINTCNFLVVIFCIINQYMFAHDLKTPRGQTYVSHYHRNDEGWTENGTYHTPEEWTIQSDGYYSRYIIQRIERANQAYNCHAYAWAGSSQSDPSSYAVIENAIDADRYINDGSYVEVAKQYGTHVSYRGKEHSLQVYSGDVMISKWGRLPLYTHKILDDIYKATIADVKYYRRAADIPADCPDIASAVNSAAGQTIHASATNYSLSSNIEINKDVILSFSSGSTLALNGYMLETYKESHIFLDGSFFVNGAIAKDGTVIKAFYPTIKSAIDNVGIFDGLSIPFETIELPSGTSFTLSENIYVPLNVALIIKNGSTVNLSGYNISSVGGSIYIESGANVNGIYVKHADGSILGLYSTIQSACDNAGSGQWVMLQPRTYSEIFSLSNKNSVNMQGNGSLLTGTVSLNNSSYCNIYGLHLSSGTYMTVNGGVSNRLNNVQADNETGVLRVYNSTYFAAYGFMAPYGYNVDFAVSAYNSTGDVCAGSNIQSQLCGVYLGQGSRFNVTDNYFCGNDGDVYAEYDGSYAYVMDNTYSSVNPVSIGGNVNYIPDNPPVACSNSMMAKSSPFSKTNGSSIASANEADKLYLELLHKMSKDELKDFSSLKAKYKSGYEKVISLSKDELRKASDIKDFRSSLSRIVHSYKWLDEKDMLSSYFDELLSDSKLEAMSPYVKRYLIDSYIDNENFKGALALVDEIMSSKDIDENLSCEMLYEKGIIYKHFLKDNSNAYISFSKITGSYPSHALSKMAKAQLSDMPEEESDKPYIKSLGTKSDEFKCSNHPNPFNPLTKFTFSIPKDGYTELKIYNSLGQEVKTLVSEVLSKGGYSFEWNANSFSSGIYYYTLKCSELVTSNKMILVK